MHYEQVNCTLVLFQTKQYLFIPSIQFLCLLNTKFSFDQAALPFIEVTSDIDMEHFSIKDLKDSFKCFKTTKKTWWGSTRVVVVYLELSSCKVFEYYYLYIQFSTSQHWQY
jgi:hypothetical protein